MTLWDQVQNLPDDLRGQITSIYCDHFPIEVRYWLARWIEEKICQNPDQARSEEFYADFFNGLIYELQSHLKDQEQPFFYRDQVNSHITRLMNYRETPQVLYNIIGECIRKEIEIIQQHSGENVIVNVMDMMLTKLNLLKQKSDEVSRKLDIFAEQVETFTLVIYDKNKTEVALQRSLDVYNRHPDKNLIQVLKIKKKSLDDQYNEKLIFITNSRAGLLDYFNESINELESLQSLLLEKELLKWKREQQLSGNGATLNPSTLDHIQNRVEKLSKIIWDTRQYIKRTESIFSKLNIQLAAVNIQLPAVYIELPILNTKITQLLSSLITSTFIIEQQPPQVMKTNTKFTASVRLLVASTLSVHMNPPQVKVSIISEQQANALLKNDKKACNGDVSGEIFNDLGVMDYKPHTHRLAVDFKNMQLKKIKRNDKRDGSASVMDEKFSLLFQSQFTIGTGELQFQVWTLSLPVVVIVHGNQESHAWATITWDNAFAEQARCPFAVPDKVKWSQVAEALNMKFTAATNKSLSPNNLLILAEKAFRVSQDQYDPSLDSVDYNERYLTWNQFCKEPLPERGFTFWDWFYCIMKIVKDFLMGYWNDNLLHGFIRKKDAEYFLQMSPEGTFLIRFSDSELGGVVLAWKQEDKVYMLSPFTRTDFPVRGLADRVLDLNYLQILYPSTDKSAFAKYQVPERESLPTNGYVKSTLKTFVPGVSSTPGSNNYNNGPTTPHSIGYQALSPDATVSIGEIYPNITLDDYILGEMDSGMEVSEDYQELFLNANYFNNTQLLQSNTSPPTQ